MSSTHSLAFFALTLTTAGFVSAPSGAKSAGQERDGALFAIENVRVFDGTAVLSGQTVVISEGKIARIGEDIETPEGARIIDGAGRTLLPGLIDSHTHVVSPAVLQQALALGVTTELDMFMHWESAQGIKEGQAEGRFQDSSDLRTAGTLVTAPGGHGTEYGFEIPTITEPGAAQEFVDARIAEGSDYIKLVYDTGKAFGISYPSIDKTTMEAVVEAAHARDKLAVVHISSIQAARDATEVGADALVHIYFETTRDPEFAAYAAQHGIFVIPTLTVLESASGVPSGAAFADQPSASPYLSAQARLNLKQAFPIREGGAKAFEAAKAAVRALHAAGVPILAGSDAPNAGTAHGASIHRELALLVDAGLTHSEALAAATSVPAQKFGLSDRGRIREGLRADLVLVEGDPTTDIAATLNIVTVWKRGEPVDREAYRLAVATRNSEGGDSPQGLAGGLVSDFESESLDTRFGAGIAKSTDALVGGKSTTDLKVVEGGAEGSRGCLAITGEIVAGAAQTWAGAMFSPGRAPMDPADLSSKKSLSFWAKGDGKTYMVMLFLQSEGFTPVVKTFSVGAEWKRHSFVLETFNGTDAHDLMGLYVGAAGAPGAFSLQIDDLRFD